MQNANSWPSTVYWVDTNTWRDLLWVWNLEGQPLPIVVVFDPAELVHYVAAGLGVDHRGFVEMA